MLLDGDDLVVKSR